MRFKMTTLFIIFALVGCAKTVDFELISNTKFHADAKRCAPDIIFTYNDNSTKVKKIEILMREVQNGNGWWNAARQFLGYGAQAGISAAGAPTTVNKSYNSGGE